mgnify:CR=1 FL=1
MLVHTNGKEESKFNVECTYEESCYVEVITVLELKPQPTILLADALDSLKTYESEPGKKNKY